MFACAGLVTATPALTLALLDRRGIRELNGASPFSCAMSVALGMIPFNSNGLAQAA